MPKPDVSAQPNYLNADQSSSTPKSPNRLSSVGKVSLIRDQTVDTPAGKQCTAQYTIADDNGLTVRHSYDVSRTEQGTEYTLVSKFLVETFAPGRSLDLPPTTTRRWEITVYGLKGPLVGDRRHDTVTTVTIADNGRVHRQTSTVPVQLDLSEFAGLSTEDLIAKMGDLHLTRKTCGILPPS